MKTEYNFSHSVKNPYLESDGLSSENFIPSDKHIVLEFTDAEEALIRHYAAENGMDVSDFIVKTVLDMIGNEK